MKKDVSVNDLDKILNTSNGGPAALNIVKKEDRQLLAFNDAQSRNEA